MQSPRQTIYYYNHHRDTKADYFARGFGALNIIIQMLTVLSAVNRKKKEAFYNTRASRMLKRAFKYRHSVRLEEWGR